jgi:hypothetical protein
MLRHIAADPLVFFAALEFVCVQVAADGPADGLPAGPLPGVAGGEAWAAIGSRFVCYDCGASFGSAVAVRCHAKHGHGRHRPAHPFGVCPACGNDYRTRLRYLEHVERGSKVCRAAVLGGGSAPRPAEEVAAADAAAREWRRLSRASGISELAGPPAIVVRQGPALMPLWPLRMGSEASDAGVIGHACVVSLRRGV